MIEPLRPDIASLLAAERSAAGCDAGSRVALRARLANTISGAAPTPSTVSTEGASGVGGVGGALGTGKLMAVIALVVGIGVATVVLTSSRDDDTAPTPAPQPVTRLEPPRVEPPRVEPLKAVVAAAPPVIRPAPAAPVTHPTSSPAPSEASLLGQAWSAIASGNARHALELADRDARLYPAGVMREERTAIEVVALAKLGRTTDAHVAAKQFLVRYPTSLHRALVEQSISTESP